jgi:hypothetical protein
MATPVTVTGTISAAANDAHVQGTVDVMLCGYGSQVPRVNGQSLVGRITTMSILADVDGLFTIQLAGNDQIVPAGTYYTITIRDENGDIAQVNAYRFLSSTSSYDLNLIDPYDPNQPPPPLPPLITNLLQIVAPANDMVFDGSIYTSFQTTLPGTATEPVFQDMVPGNLYTFIIIQDAAGGHDFVWAANVHNAMPVNPVPNGRLIQTFVAESDGSLWAIAAGTYWP